MDDLFGYYHVHLQDELDFEVGFNEPDDHRYEQERAIDERQDSNR
jgi:hypothetical protein